MLVEPQIQGIHNVSNAWRWVRRQAEHEETVGDHQKNRSVESWDLQLVRSLSISMTSFQNNEGSSMVDFAVTNMEARNVSTLTYDREPGGFYLENTMDGLGVRQAGAELPVDGILSRPQGILGLVCTPILDIYA